MEVRAMGVGRRGIKGARGRGQVPGRPSNARRDNRVRFWKAVARGATTEEAAIGAGVSGSVGSHWFGQAGGMPPLSLVPLSGRYLSFADREEIAILYAQQHGVREIARRLGRPPSTISRELERNTSVNDYRVHYRATIAQAHADRRAKRPKVARLAANGRLRAYVEDRLAGTIERPGGGR
jgi:Helix-turn-helix domain